MTWEGFAMLASDVRWALYSLRNLTVVSGGMGLGCSRNAVHLKSLPLVELPAIF